MKLIEALEVIRKHRSSNQRAFTIPLVCGFTPLHLQTFLTANLSLTHPERKVEVTTGLYGDFWGNLERVNPEAADGCCIALEWSDLDARLGYRSSGSWSPDEIPAMVENVGSHLSHIAEKLSRISALIPVAVSLPTLHLPPISFTPSWLASDLELELREAVATIASKLARMENVKVGSTALLDKRSPHHERHDLKSEILSGFPYTLPHASAVAGLLSNLLKPSQPKKGLITDLDDTFWDGILGEVDVAGVSWDLDHGTHMHGVYQGILAALALAGTFIGVASKNDSQIVSRAFERPDLRIPKEALFPIDANWGPKSASITRILNTWNIGASDVVFVDDNPMEIAEVQSVHPEMLGICFPKNNSKAIEELLWHLRDLFGKNALSTDDRLRLKSVRRRVEVEQEQDTRGSQDDFLKKAEGHITVEYSKTKGNSRAFELVNKTNQFNLNGRRFTDVEWRKFLAEPAMILLVSSYEDKFGPLGKIAVLAGKQTEKSLVVHVWVMSCRAFSRRIEHHLLDVLFNRYGLEEISFDFEPTAKNSPLQSFLADVIGRPPFSNCTLSRSDFERQKPHLYHLVTENLDE